MLTRLLILLVMLALVSGCSTYVFTEHKKETLPNGTVHEYDEELPLWMQVASMAKLVLAGEGKPTGDDLMAHRSR